MGVLQVAQLGNDVLRCKAQPVNNISDKNLGGIIDNLIATVIETNGVGIAAPQVSISDRLFISPRTVQTHLSKVENSLLVSSLCL